MRKNLESIKVMFIESEDGTRGAKVAFSKLESKLPTLKGRKFYGASIGNPNDGEYRACVEIISEDDPKKMKLDTWVIPGGWYEQEKLRNWNNKLDQVGKIVSRIIDKYGIDSTRPVIEYYVSMRELRILVPIKS